MLVTSIQCVQHQETMGSRNTTQSVLFTVNTIETNLSIQLRKLRLAIHLLLSSEWEQVCAFFAVVCSSWVPVNRGSTGRSIMTPLGCEDFPHVRKSNKLTSRTLCWYIGYIFLSFPPQTHWALMIGVHVYIEGNSQNIAPSPHTWFYHLVDRCSTPFSQKWWMENLPQMGALT